MEIRAEITSLRRAFPIAFLGLTLLTATGVDAQQSDPNKNVYIVTNVDLAANGERLAAATTVLREFAAAYGAGWALEPLHYRGGVANS